MKKILKIINKWRLDYLSLALIMSAYYGLIQKNNLVGDPDGFYHTKMALFIRQGQILQNLPWMQFSNLRENFVDHQFLYHVILAPFTDIINPIMGVKIATVSLTVLMVLIFYWFLKSQKIAWPYLFSVAILVLNGLNFRLSLIKANSLSLIIVWFLLYALLKKKLWLIFLISFIFVLSYGVWPIAILILLAYVVGDWIFLELNHDKLKMFWNRTVRVFTFKKKPPQYLKISLALLAGLSAGVIINPYWPKNVSFYQELIKIALYDRTNEFFKVGGEWYGTNIMSLISSAPHLFIAIVIITLILAFNYKKISQLSWISFLLMLGFLILTLKSKRYLEYYMPFGLLFVASGSNDIKKFFNKKRIKKFWKITPKYVKVYLFVILIIFATSIIPATYNRIFDIELPDRWPNTKLSGPANWLHQNTAPGDIVFHADWDEWPALFYHNDHNYYMLGLDPGLMESYNHELHKLYVDIVGGEIRYGIGNLIQERFGANYIIAEKNRHQIFIANLNLAPDINPVYANENVIIYQIE